MDETLLLRVGRAFDVAEVPYAFVGHTAAQVWGAPGGRDEVEVLARLLPGDVERLIAAAQAEGLESDPGLAVLAAESGDDLSLFAGGDDVFVDVKPTRNAAEVGVLRTRVPHRWARGEVQVAGLEETLARLLDLGTPAALAAARTMALDHGPDLDEELLLLRCEDLGVAWRLGEVSNRILTP